MSYVSRPSPLDQRPPRLRRFAVALIVPMLGLPALASGQTVDRWASTADRYDAAGVAAFLDQVAADLAQRHGPLAERLFSMNAQLTRTPHELQARTADPVVPRVTARIEAAHLVHHQALGNGSLGRLHGSSMHPVGVGWFPHSMFAQSGRVFANWGHARLLAAVRSHADRHSD